MAAESLSNALPPAKRSKPDSPHDVDLAASSAVGPTSLQNTHTAVANGALVLPSSMGRVDVLSEFLTRAAPGSSAGKSHIFGTGLSQCLEMMCSACVR